MAASYTTREAVYLLRARQHRAELASAGSVLGRTARGDGHVNVQQSSGCKHEEKLLLKARYMVDTFLEGTPLIL